MPKILRPIPMDRMLEHIARELEMSASVFSVPPGYRGSARLPLGLAAGPNTRMAQSLAAGYVSGARSFELAAVSPDQAGLDDQQVLEEYIKGSVVIQLLDRELGLGNPQGAIFALRVKADEAWLKGEAMTAFLRAMEDASETPAWRACLEAARGAARRFNNVEKEDLAALDPHISRIATLDWGGDLAALSPCAAYLLDQGLHVYIDLNPTALGPIGLGGCFAAQGGGDGALDVDAFGPDLEELGAVIDALRERAEARGLRLGLRVCGAVPLKGGGRLEGRAAAPMTMLLCARAAARWPGVPMVWAGETDQFNMGTLSRLGFRTVAVEDTLRRPGGYLHLRQLARAAAGTTRSDHVDAREAEDTARAWSRREYCRVGRQPPQRRRIPQKAPLTDCFTAPCQAGCPFGMDITGALRLMSDGRYRDALRVILDKNPLPNLTGALCPQPCGARCTRIFYDRAVQVRQAEALCAANAWGEMLARLTRPEPHVGHRVAVAGASPAGMAAAILLARRGVAVTLFEASSQLCPILRRTDPELGELIDRDGQQLTALGVDLRRGAPAPEAQALLQNGYSHVILAPEGEESADQLRLSGAEGEEAAPADERVFLLTPPTEDQGGVARAIADVQEIVTSLLGPSQPIPHPTGRRGGAMGKKGKVCLPGSPLDECERCLECATVCECCVDVCPHRANVPIAVPTRAAPQILHLDGLCGRCGVCGAFCPYDSDPGADKFTLFETVEDFDRSENQGFVVLDFLARKIRLRLAGEVRDVSLKSAERWANDPIRELVETVFIDYPYLLDAQRQKETAQTSLFDHKP